MGKKPSGKGDYVNNGETNLNRVYRRSLITMKQNTYEKVFGLTSLSKEKADSKKANNGAIIASPTLMTPVYAFTWPRDGCVIASLMTPVYASRDGCVSASWFCLFNCWL
jgi:GH15 family glucan-1,4-alpha-glucosidase